MDRHNNTTHSPLLNQHNWFFRTFIRPMSHERALRYIRYGWQAGLVASLITGFFIIATRFVHVTTPLTIYSLIDIAIMILLTVGVARKSRIAAVTMLIYFLANRIYYWVQVDMAAIIASLPLTVVFLYFFVQAVRGTFSYHTTK